MWILTRLLQQLQPILLHNTLRNIVICVYNTWSIILWYSYYWSGNWYCYQKPMIAVCRGGNTDLKCPSSTLQRGFWQVADAFSEKFFQNVLSTKISRTLRRNIPGTELQGSSGARPSKPLSKGCGLVRNSQEGRWKRGLEIKDIFEDIFMVLWWRWRWT